MRQDGVFVGIDEPKQGVHDMIRFTFDAEDDRIEENARIHSFKNTHALEEFLSDCDIVGTEIGQFGDCWVKMYSPPREDDVFDDIPVAELNVSRPGTHPGGNAWWLTPKDNVLVPVWGDEE